MTTIKIVKCCITMLYSIVLDLVTFSKEIQKMVWK
jgi:hypothetical protein